MPVVFGKPLSNTLGNKPFTSPSTWFIILDLNCSDVTYLYVKKPPPHIPKTRIVDTMVKASRIFLIFSHDKRTDNTSLLTNEFSRFATNNSNQSSLRHHVNNDKTNSREG